MMPPLGRLAIAIAIAILTASAALLGSDLRAQGKQGATSGGDPRAVRPADELFWVPTLEQAIEMATANGVPVFAMGYSLVGDRSTYTRFGDNCASAVF